jgi:transcriptional regulator with XRE-family HTH domain
MPKAGDGALALLGENIRRFREQRAISQEQLAFEAGLDRTYVGGAERGERNLTILSALKVSRALNVELSELVEGLK